MERDRRQNGYRRCICQRWRRCIVSKRLCATDSRTVIWKLPPIWRPSRQVRHFLSSWSQTQQEQVVLPWLQIKMELTSAPTIAHTIVLVETTFSHTQSHANNNLSIHPMSIRLTTNCRARCVSMVTWLTVIFSPIQTSISYSSGCAYEGDVSTEFEPGNRCRYSGRHDSILNLMVEIHIDIPQISDVQVTITCIPTWRIVIILFGAPVNRI
jgi:hypothetical protein